MAFNFTKSQELAINSRGSAVLVSAAAGSGKTRVLTERLMAYLGDADDPKDIDSFLIITYTRAAAAELRARILSELLERRAKEPDNRRLRRQINLCYRAQIGTIHSFCASILRENAHVIGFSPDFKIADEDKNQQLKLLALDKVLSDAYEKATPEFLALADSIGSGRDDRRLEDTILSLYSKMMSQKNPEKWVQKQKYRLEFEGVTDIAHTNWGMNLIENISDSLWFWADELENLQQLIHSNPEYAPMVKAYDSSLAESALAIRDTARQFYIGWDAASRMFPIPFPRIGSVRKPEYPEICEKVKDTRNLCKKEMANLANDMSQASSQAIAELKTMSPVLMTLLDITLELDRVFAAEKKQRNLMDYADLEHLTLQLLADENEEPTEIARELSKRYTEIMVDEFQDVNAVQDLICRLISKDENNLFMVGDVKQSIYRFRLADPTIFLEKYHDFEPANRARTGEPRKILLSENFRSRDCVLSSANRVFEAIMSEKLGELEYDKQARLNCGADYYDPNYECKTEVLVVPEPDKSDDDDDSGKLRLEAIAVGRKIQRLMRAGAKVQGAEGMRPLKYSDIALLMRSVNKVRAIYSTVFMELGIPLLDSVGESFFKTPEISAMVSMLAIIDNPQQDIALISVLRSNFFGFSPDELAQIRATNRQDTFYNALVEAAETNEKYAEFIEKLEKLRLLASDLPTDELLSRIYSETDAVMLLSAMQGGEQKCRNIMQLLEYSKKFESDGFRGVFKFVAMLRRLAERGEEPNMPSVAVVDGVSIMSIHKSKGLEFPYVFVCDTGRGFNKSDMYKTVLVHGELGISSKIIDTVKGMEYASLSRRSIANKMLFEMLSEEMRVLYVAMTRAKERLFISCSMKNPMKKIEKWSELSLPIAPKILEKANSLSQWVLQVALNRPDEFEVIVVSEHDDIVRVEEAVIAKNKSTPELVELIKSRQQFSYKFENSADIPSKLTATELKKLEQPEENTERLIKLTYKNTFRLPELGGERELTAAEKGTATHVVMQYIDFAKTKTLEQIENEIARLRLEGYIDKRQSLAVNAKSILTFFSSELGARLERADAVYRELPFSLLCKASDYYASEENEEILLQGVLDCCIEENGKICIIDYKTDRVSRDRLAELVKTYEPQVRAYAMAMSRIMQKEVSETILFFLRGSVGVVLDGNGEFVRILS